MTTMTRPTYQPNTRPVYTTETNGLNDHGAQRKHREAVAKMARAAARKPCLIGHDQWACTCLPGSL